jgi:DNA-binding XRE family transcriptional regulator
VLTKKPSGDKLRALRESRSWSQEKLARITNVSARTIQRIEGGQGCKGELLQAIAKVLDVEPDELFATESDGGMAKKTPPIAFIPRMGTGNQLCSVVAGAGMLGQDTETLANEHEVQLVGGFLQEVSDVGEMWNDMEPLLQVEAEYHVTQLLQSLTEAGFFVFAHRTRGHLNVGHGKEPVAMTMATVIVLRETNPAIIRLPSGQHVAATAQDHTIVL